MLAASKIFDVVCELIVCFSATNVCGLVQADLARKRWEKTRPCPILNESGLNNTVAVGICCEAFSLGLDRHWSSADLSFFSVAPIFRLADAADSRDRT